MKTNDRLKNVSIPKGLEIDNVNLTTSKISLLAYQKIIGQHPESQTRYYS